jgi:hypothetical protein
MKEEKIKKAEAQKIFRRFPVNIIPALTGYLKHPEDAMRLGSIKTLALLGSAEQISILHDSLLDSHIQVRQAAFEAIVEKMGSQPPVPFPAGEEKNWNEKVEKWISGWSKDEEKAQLATELANLEKDAQEIKDTLKIWTSPQAKSARSMVTYLQSSFTPVREKAFAHLEKLAKEEEKKITFKADGSAEERKQNIEDITEWLEKVAKKVQDQEKDLQQKLSLLDKKEGDILTVEGCKKLQKLMDEMTEEENGHPTLQQKYVEVLKKKGYMVQGYNPMADRKERNKGLLKIGDDIHDIKEKLKEAEKEGEQQEQELKEAWGLKAIRGEEDIKLAHLLVKALSHLDYSLRKKAIQTLSLLAGEDRGFQADAVEAERQKAISHWQEWLKEQGKRLLESRKSYIANVKGISEAFGKAKKIEDLKGLQNARFLVEALQDKEKETRDFAIAGLKVLSQGKDFQYNSANAPEKEKAAISEWGKWIEHQESTLSKVQEIQEVASYLQSAPKAETAEQAGKIGMLVEALGSTELAIRKIAFTALSQYVSKYVPQEVREDFGYDPAAPEEIRQKTKAHWDKWFKDKVSTIASQEEARLSQVKKWVEELPTDILTATSDGEVAARLVDALQDIAPSVRQAAFQALCKFSSGETYHFQPEKKSVEQTQELALWKWWIKLEKRKIEEKIERRISHLRKTMEGHLTIEKPERVDMVLAPIMKGLEDREMKIRELALTYAQTLSKEKFSFQSASSPEARKKGLEEVRAWFTAKKGLLKGEEKKLELKEKTALLKGVATKEDLDALKNLKEALESEYLQVREFAIERLNKLSGKAFAYKPADPEKKRLEALREIEQWYDSKKKEIEQK